MNVEIETFERPEDWDTVIYADLPKGSLLGVSSGLGSAIDVGGTVTVTVAGPRFSAQL